MFSPPHCPDANLHTSFVARTWYHASPTFVVCDWMHRPCCVSLVLNPRFLQWCLHHSWYSASMGSRRQQRPCVFRNLPIRIPYSALIFLIAARVRINNSRIEYK